MSKDLRRLSQEYPDKTKIFDLFNELTDTNDRAAALIAASHLDHVLGQSLCYKFVNLSKEEISALFLNMGAPVSTFSARIKIGHAVGLFSSNVRDYLDIIRNIRNAFAHSLSPITFQEPAIKTEVNKLPDGPPLKLYGKEGLSVERKRFIAVTFQIMKMLMDSEAANHGHPPKVDFDYPEQPAGAPGVSG